MTWKGCNEVFYAACDLRRAVECFGDRGGRIASRHKQQQKCLCLSATRQRTNGEAVKEQRSRCKTWWVRCLIAAAVG